MVSDVRSAFPADSLNPSKNITFHSLIGLTESERLAVSPKNEWNVVF